MTIGPGCTTARRTRASRQRTFRSKRSSRASRNITTLRQLARLTRRVPAAGPRACAIGVYANDQDRALAARDRGFEGVACVDDAARAVVLFLDLWHDTGDRRLRDWATGLLDFVLYLRGDDGRFHNFIHDWDGTVNTDGPTSFAGVTFWQARAVRALAKAHLALRDQRVALPLARGFAFATENPAPPDVRAIHVLAALDLVRAGQTPVLREALERWFDGRNPAEKPVYDRENGRVQDGIDDGRLNPHSGAESNIVGAQALFHDIASRVGPMLDAVSDRLDEVVEVAAA